MMSRTRFVLRQIYSPGDFPGCITMMVMEQKKVAVIGAGAAGLMAAAAASEKGHKVTVFEKNEKAGKKLYITGKGRGNLTNACDTQDFFTHVMRNPKFLYSSVYEFDADQVIRFFEKNGCPTKVERGKRVFPRSDHASDITAALLRNLKQKNVKICYNTRVTALLSRENSRAEDSEDMEVTEEKPGKSHENHSAGIMTGLQAVRPDGRVETIFFDAVIVCTGGLSYPSTGSTGDGYKWARNCGHRINLTAPSLVPLVVRESWCRDLQGLALRNVRIDVFPSERNFRHDTEPEPGRRSAENRNESAVPKRRKKKAVYSGFGEMLFTHFGVSGPLILSASCKLDFTDPDSEYILYLNLKPALREEQLTHRIEREFSTAPRRKLENAIRPLFPERLAAVVAQLCGIDPQRTAGSVGRKEIVSLARFIQKIPITISGTRGYEEAIITKGGVSVKDIDPSTMESRIVKGLYFAGEVIDVDAVTGGFNLQIAWSTGHKAGASV